MVWNNILRKKLMIIVQVFYSVALITLHEFVLFKNISKRKIGKT